MQNCLDNPSKMRASSTIFTNGVVVLLALLLVECSCLESQVKTGTSSGSTSIPSQTQTPAPTITAVPASDFDLGVIEIPKGYILLLSHHTWRVCAKECDCPAVEGLPRGYEIHGDRLYLSQFGMDPSWEEGSLPAIVYAKGDCEEALLAVNELPFTLDESVPILAAFEDGAIVFVWQGDAYQLATGGIWQTTRSSDYGGGCVITDFSSFSNLGLWDEDQVEIKNYEGDHTSAIGARGNSWR
jgi:hypothetical protein